jgi:predicted dehydrogenase
MAAPLRFTLVGPARTRAGLGPFYARHAETAGARVVAVAGRDLARARGAAHALAGELGHPVAAAADVATMLAEHRPDALIVASPEGAHREALEAALAARVPVLCEKPLLAPEQLGAAPALLDRFARERVALWESCQWPELLAGLAVLLPAAGRRPAASLALGLGPAGRGRAMLVDSLSHFLSLLQAVAPVGPEARLERAAWEGRGPDTGRLVLRARFATAGGAVDGLLELTHCPRQPRPAWLAVDGARAEREIDLRGYRMRLRAGDRIQPVRDPLEALVYRFAACVREPRHERAAAELAAIRERARLFQDVLASHDAG